MDDVDDVRKSKGDEPVFGKFLFGAQRGKPNKNEPEANTPDENWLLGNLDNHYSGMMTDLSPWIPLLTQLKNKGKYLDVLQVPKKYKYAYRVITLSLVEAGKHLPVITGIPNFMLPSLSSLSDTKLLKHFAVKQTGGVYKEVKTQRNHSSWSVDPAVFAKIHEDWGSLDATAWVPKESGLYFVFMRALVHESGNEFLLNPDVTPELGRSAKYFAYQREIISVGDVALEDVWIAHLQHRDDDDGSVAREFGQVTESR